MKVKFDDGAYIRAESGFIEGLHLHLGQEGETEDPTTCWYFSSAFELFRLAEFLLKVARKHPAFN